MNTAHEPSWYEIRLQGRLDQRWATWFDGMVVLAEPDGVTVLRGPVDQAALHGLLARLRDLGLPLLSVTQSHADYHDVAADADPDHGTDR